MALLKVARPAAATGAAWYDEEVSESTALSQMKLLMSATSIRHLGNTLLRRHMGQSAQEHAEGVWQFCSLVDLCLESPTLESETRVALAVNPGLVGLLWTDFLKARPSQEPESPHTLQQSTASLKANSQNLPWIRMSNRLLHLDAQTYYSSVAAMSGRAMQKFNLFTEEPIKEKCKPGS